MPIVGHADDERRRVRPVDDFVGIGVDTSGAGSQVYYFETTPRGCATNSRSKIRAFDRAGAAAAQSVDGAWSAVMIIPLNVIRVPRGGKQTWRFQFVRGIAARGEHVSWVWDPIMQDAASGTWPVFRRTRAFGPRASSISRPQRRHGRSRAPTSMRSEPSAQDRNLVQQANGTFLPMNVRWYGGDLSYPLTPTIRFVGTLNPDFSNVEIDQQTIAPQEFERQLVEYRPFFAQGAAYINADSGVRAPVGTDVQAPYLVFYSPSVGPFDSGEKVEGTFDENAFGALTFHGYDATTNNTFSDSAYGFQHAVPGGTFTYWSDGVFANHSIAGWDNTIENGFEDARSAKRDDRVRRLFVRKRLLGSARTRRPRAVLRRSPQGQHRIQLRLSRRLAKLQPD